MKHLYYTCVMLFCVATCAANYSTIASPDTSAQPARTLSNEVRTNLAGNDFTQLVYVTENPVSSHTSNISMNIRYTGHFKNKKLNGAWNSWYQSGNVCDSGTLTNNVPDGVWKVWYANGTLRYVRTYNAFLMSKVKSEINNRDGKLFNTPLAWLAKSDLASAEETISAGYSFNTPDNDRTIYGRIHLPTLVAANISSQYYKPPFFSCLQHGLYMNYFEDGAVQDSGYYNNGLKDGLWTETTEVNNRRITTTGAYENGAKSREWKYYDDRGRLVKIVIYNKRGKLMFEKEFN